MDNVVIAGWGAIRMVNGNEKNTIKSKSTQENYHSHE